MGEIAVWGCVVVSRLPTWLMPASLTFMLKFLSLSDTIYVDGTTLVLNECKLKEISNSKLMFILRTKYTTAILFFMWQAFGSSNVLLLPRLLNPIELGSHTATRLADFMTVFDLSKLTLDDAYIEESQDDVATVRSLQEGIEGCTDYLWGGFVGMSDVVKKPMQKWHEKGLLGLPEGLCRGVISGVVKPIDGLIRAFSMFLRGLAQLGYCRVRRRGPRANSNSNGPRLPAEAPPQAGNVPRLMGADCLRLPRLLFADDAVVAPFLQWQAELSLRLGPELTSGICAIWRLAGNVDETLHLMLYASYAQLLLVDLNRSKPPKKVDNNTFRLLKSLSRQRRLDTLIKTAYRRSYTRRRETSGGYLAWMKSCLRHIDNDIYSRQVLGSWLWADLARVSISDEAEPSLRPPTESELLEQGWSGRGSEGSRWVISITDSKGDSSEWPLLGSTLSSECYRTVCEDINQIIEDLGTS